MSPAVRRNFSEAGTEAPVLGFCLTTHFRGSVVGGARCESVNLLEWCGVLRGAAPFVCDLAPFCWCAPRVGLRPLVHGSAR